MLTRVRDLDERVNTGRVVEWQSPAGTRYRWERHARRAGLEISPGAGRWLWLDAHPADLRAARRVVLDHINSEEL
ncbi:hypothetical protein [Halomonas sp.]|uniref:hypothetical protein n=1 Tax=Halomonas sp. TaxID=1486246 RepID=UPI00298ECF7A|nr:hypothetical protein [Halomonas sp.]MDW7746737.1 hypothetical protein [Halomonas sp.]